MKRRNSDPSLPLMRPQRERFAQLLAAGTMTSDKAYVQAGFQRDNANAFKLSRHPEVAARVEYLQRISADKATTVMAASVGKELACRDWVLEKLIKNARISMGEEEVTITKTTGSGENRETVVATEFMRDASAANRALHLVGLELGMFKTESAAPPGEVDAARSANDPRIAEQLKRYADGPRLLAIDGGKKDG